MIIVPAGELGRLVRVTPEYSLGGQIVGALFIIFFVALAIHLYRRLK